MSNGRNRRLLAKVTGLLAPLALVGCLSDKPDPNRPDPLTGLPKRIPPSERAVSSTYNPERTESAVLASSRNTEGVSGLSIRDGRDAESDRNSSVTAAGAWTGTESRTSPPPSRGARLGGPPATPAPASTTGGSVRVRTFEEAQQFLMAHGVKWQDLQTTGDGQWKFACSIPNKGSSTSVRTYEETDRYGLIAMQKVIDKIVRDQSK